jgi:type I restriction enzyme S subunit
MRNIPEGYKKEKNRIIPSDWNFVKIETILEKIGNRVEVKKEENYRQIGIRSHGKGLFYKELVAGEELGSKSVFWIEKDCFIVNIVFAWEQAIGRTTENEVGMICSHRFPMYIPIDNKIDIDYLVYLFKTPYGKKVLELASPGGAGRNKTLGQKGFSNSEILIPNSIEEQKKIIKILSVWDLAIEMQEHLINKKKEFKKGLMQRIFAGELRFKDFNKEWEVLKLGELVKFYSSKTLEKYFNKCSDYKVVSIGNYSPDGKYIDNNSRIELNEETKRYLLCKDDLAMVLNDKTKVGRIIGRVLLIDEDDRFIFNQRTARLVVQSDNITSKYLYYYINNDDFHDEIVKIAQGGTQIYINLGPLLKIGIRVPSLSEQFQIITVLDNIYKEIELLQKELQALKMQKKGLMQRLLTGEVRVEL